MNSENIKTSDHHRLLLNLLNKYNLRQICCFIKLCHILCIKISYKNNKFKTSGITWNSKYELSDEPYSVSGTQDYFEYIIKKHKTMTDNLLTRIYVKIKRK